MWFLACQCLSMLASDRFVQLTLLWFVACAVECSSVAVSRRGLQPRIAFERCCSPDLVINVGCLSWCRFAANVRIHVCLRGLGAEVQHSVGSLRESPLVLGKCRLRCRVKKLCCAQHSWAESVLVERIELPGLSTSSLWQRRVSLQKSEVLLLVGRMRICGGGP